MSDARRRIACPSRSSWVCRSSVALRGGAYGSRSMAVEYHREGVFGGFPHSDEVHALRKPELRHLHEAIGRSDWGVGVLFLVQIVWSTTRSARKSMFAWRFFV